MKNICSVKKISFFLLLAGTIGLHALDDERSSSAGAPRNAFDFEFMCMSRTPIWISIWQEVEEDVWDLIAQHIELSAGDGFYRIKNLGKRQNIKIQIHLSPTTRSSIDYIISPNGRTSFVTWDGRQLYATRSVGKTTASGLPIGNNITNNNIHALRAGG